MYKNLKQYINNNEIFEYDKSIDKDTYDEKLIQFIKEHFDDEEMLHDLDTVIIKEMFMYYTKHTKGV